MWPVDQLFATQWNERLGFAHWDTEGNELDILRGAVGTLRRDAPIFTVGNRRTQIAAVHCCSATVLLAITLTVRFWKCHPAITLPLLTTSASCRVGPTPYRLLATLP